MEEGITSLLWSLTSNLLLTLDNLLISNTSSFKQWMSCSSWLASPESSHVWVLSSDIDLLLGDFKKKTFSAVGFGHDSIPFLSTQQSACNIIIIIKNINNWKKYIKEETQIRIWFSIG